MSRHFIVRPLTVAAALAACAVAVPSASARPIIAEPDAINQTPAADQQQVTTRPTDLRSPDARAAAAFKASTESSDLRSPDARAAASDPRARTFETPTVIKVGSGSGFDWGDAGIGAGGMLAVVALAGGAVLLVTRRRPERPGVSPAAS